MKQNLIIINWVRRKETILTPLAEEMPKHFDQVFVVGRDIPHIYDDIQDLPVYLRLVTRSAWLVALLKLPTIFARAELWRDITLAWKIRKLSIHYIIHLVRTFVVGELLRFSTARIIHQSQEDGNWFVLSLWFDARAYGAALTKRMAPEIVAGSLAHSVEIEPKKNPYHILMLKHYTATYLDLIAFISDAVKEKYISNSRNHYPLPLGRIKTYYLGSRKPHDRDMLARMSRDGIFRIVTCSGVREVKRVALIAEALANWSSDQPLEWTHFGDGPLFHALQNYAHQINRSTVPVTIILPGAVEHRQIFNYYSTHCVDLFINVSAAEGLPVSIMEACSYGIPIIAANVDGNSEIVSSKNGLLLTPDPEPKEIRDAIKRIVEMPLSEKQSLRNESIKIWQERFDAHITMAKLAKDFINLSNHKNES